MFAKQPAKDRPGAKAQASVPAMNDLSQARKPPKVVSVIADDLTVDGSLTGQGELHVDGTIRGDIRIGRLTLGETGHIEGNVYAETVEARGRIIGSVTAKVVRLFATAYIDGDVTHEQLAMETGAFFQGRAQKFQRPVAVSAPMSAEVLPLKAGE
jgi:cytoskeletal protein CcmA (bactofilin family)